MCIPKISGSQKFEFSLHNFQHQPLYLLSTIGTQSSGTKLNHNFSSTNKHHNHYFIRICRLWNALPITDLHMSMHTIKKHLKIFKWNYFSNHFDLSSINSHFSLYCPCNSYLSSQCLQVVPTFPHVTNLNND